jgi:ABC-type bacteriocin/lantibiotic exporter with double-glycine peptidase domain
VPIYILSLTGGEVFVFRQQKNRWWFSFPSELRWLAKQIRPLVHWHAASFLCTTAGSVLALLTPLVLKWLIDRVIPQKNTELLLFSVLLIFLGYQGRTALTSLGNFLMLNAAQKLSLTLRVNMLRHIDTLSAEYYENTPVGTVMYPLKEPIDEVSYFGSDLLPAMLRLVLSTGFTLGTMFLLSPVLTLAVVPLIPVFLITRQRFRKRLGNDADTVQEDRLAWSSFLEEHLSSVIPIQLLGQEKRQERRAFRLLARAVRSHQKLFTTGAWFTVWSSLAVALALCAVIGYGGASVLAGSLSVGGLVAFYGFVTQLFEPLSGAAELYARAQKTFASVRQVQSALGLCPRVENAPDSVHLPEDHDPKIEFAGVEFAYPRQRELLHVPALQIMAGERVAMAGENGAGKSTLGKLLVRLYDPIRGSIRLGGEDIRNIRLASLRRHICYLSREPVLFDGTLASNLRLVRPSATERDLDEAIRNVGLSSFVSTLPDGLRQRIGPGGCQLSGGQRQRLALARALLQRPRVLILDEATSCLDPPAEALVLENIRRDLRASTLLVVSHRPSTFAAFERVLILSGGRVVKDCGPDVFTRAQDSYATLAVSDTADCRELFSVNAVLVPPCTRK